MSSYFTQREEQINYLIAMAEDIVTHSGITAPEQAREGVAFWLDTDDPSNVLPPWFDAHDRYLLEEFVADLLRPKSERVRL
ncbi:MAG: hypothetical protein ACXABY_23000 [Candidatus Thorarchaeota archaeon]|jgi:hypothetical protein